MTGVSTFPAWAPKVVTLAAAGDVGLRAFVRSKLFEIDHWDLPLGWTDQAGAWVLCLPMKLESPNRYRAHWTLLNGARTKWEQLVWATVAKAEGCATATAVRELGRAPACAERMALTIVRLVTSSREFIRDDDNLAFSRKSLTDALKRVGLIKEDRREWLAAAPPVQDVSPLDVPITIVILRPAVAGLFPGVPDVHDRQCTPPSDESLAPHREAERRRVVRHHGDQSRARAAHAGAGQAAPSRHR